MNPNECAVLGLRWRPLPAIHSNIPNRAHNSRTAAAILEKKSGPIRTIGLGTRGRQSLKSAQTHKWPQLMYQLTNLNQTKAAATFLATRTLPSNLMGEVA